jgi:hypothetical protein
MRIEKLQISKYGKLNNFREIKFEPNLNVIFAKNGVGKTSLAHAIFHTLFGVGLKFFKYPYSEDGKITGQTTDVQLIVNKNGENHNVGLKKLSKDISKNNLENLGLSNELKNIVEHYFFTDSDVVRQVADKIDFSQNSRQQLQEIIASASAIDNNIEVSITGHLKEMNELITFGKSGFIKPSTEINKLIKNLEDVRNDIREADKDDEDLSTPTINKVEKLQEEITQLEEKIQLNNNHLTQLLAKENWIKDVSKYTNKVGNSVLKGFSNNKYLTKTFNQISRDLIRFGLQEEKYNKNLQEENKISKDIKKLEASIPNEKINPVEIDSFILKFNDLQKQKELVDSLNKKIQAPKLLFSELKKEHPFLTKSNYEYFEKNELKENKRNDISDLHSNLELINTSIENYEELINEDKKKINSYLNSKKGVDTEEIISETEKAFKSNKINISKLDSQNTKKETKAKIIKDIIDSEDDVLSKLKSIDKNIDSIGEYKANVKSKSNNEALKEKAEKSKSDVEVKLITLIEKLKLPKSIKLNEDFLNFLENVDEIYFAKKESLSATKEVKAEKLELTKLQNAFKKMCKDINYDIKNLTKLDLEDIKKRCEKHNNLASSYDTKIKELKEKRSKKIGLSKDIKEFVDYNKKLISDYKIKHISDLQNLVSISEIISRLSSDNILKDIKNPEKEKFLKSVLNDNLNSIEIQKQITSVNKNIASDEDSLKTLNDEYHETMFKQGQKPNFDLELYVEEEKDIKKQITLTISKYFSIILGLHLALEQLKSVEIDNIDFIKVANDVLPKINDKFIKLNYEDETQEVSIEYKDTLGDVSRKPGQLSHGENSALALGLRLVAQSVASKNEFEFPLIFDDCTETLDDLTIDNFFDLLFSTISNNQIIYLTKDKSIVNKLKELNPDLNLIELENYKLS